MAHSEMRDGNEPAREGNARVLLEALERLPGAVEEVTVRSDSAAHVAEVIRLCNRPETRPEAGGARRLGVVGLVISAVHSEALMNQVMRTPETAWKPLGEKPKEPEAEVASSAEINFMSNSDAHRKGPEILRYIAVRRPRPGSLGVKANEIPARDGHPAYGIWAPLTNIPAPGGSGRTASDRNRRRQKKSCPSPTAAAATLSRSTIRSRTASPAASCPTAGSAAPRPGGTVPSWR